jgi:hypothetical protein
MQWMEFHDQPWFPRSFRDGVTDALQFIMNLGGVYDPMVHPEQRTGINRDTCSP